jgi:release factor glutamine methyltransferase
LSTPLAASATVGEALGDGVARLRAAGVESPRLDAELLLAEVLDPAGPVDRSELILRATESVDQPARQRFEELLQRRQAREPVAYILGRRLFRHIELAVDERVLIPRPETELLVEVGLALPSGSKVLDLGTGSGAVALALKHERPDLEVSGSDVSAGAIEVARDNARRLGLEVRFACADLLEGLDGSPDAVLANLPYVSEGSTALAPEITRYEPPGALFAGPDGLEVIRRLVGMLEGIPQVALEVGFDQSDAVQELLRQGGFGSVQALRDLAGHERVVVARRSVD